MGEGFWCDLLFPRTKFGLVWISLMPRSRIISECLHKISTCELDYALIKRLKLVDCKI